MYKLLAYPHLSWTVFSYTSPLNLYFEIFHFWILVFWNSAVCFLMCLTCWREARPTMNTRMAWRNVQGVTYQMHQPEPSEHKSASPFQYAKPKRVGWRCPSSVVNWWVEITRWAKVCAVHSLNSCPASSLDLVLWALWKVCDNASTCHMTSHTPWHVKLLFSGIHRNIDLIMSPPY